MEGDVMSHTVALIQARMSSSRFPGKVLESLQGMPMIVYMVKRALRAVLLDEVVVVTSTDSSDDVLAQTLEAAKVKVFRGDLADVLKRYADAAAQVNATEVVRLTGDCPLIDPSLIDAVVRLRRDAGCDYASNIDPPTFPDGLDVECFTRAALVQAHEQASALAEREHVTLWMRSAQAHLSRQTHHGLVNLSHVRLTVDYPDDLAVVRELTSAWPPEAQTKFDLYDLMRVMAARPEILALNPHARNEGLLKSLGMPAATISNI
jgi:spore coat polysaccharide biosynthesis protein SpsF